MAALRLRQDAAIATRSRKLLMQLPQLDWAGDFYLAGSAALALYLDHRPVRDLDFMSSVRRLRSIERRDLLQDLLRLDPETKVETARDGFLYVRAGGGVAVRLYYYPYPLVDREELLGNMAVASPVDLGLMKLGAIISRGTRRDFVDLYLLCREIPLADLLTRSPNKFGHVVDFPLQALKGLADLSQIEGEPMPDLHRSLTWDEVEEWLARQVRALGRRQVGLDVV